ncbi:MAG: 50S ribosomal protein L23 [Clostridia bacterium]|nr:50S ribosomal protein L23 [Clostridia bacterium]
MNQEVTRNKKAKVTVDGKEVLKSTKDSKGKFVKETATVRKYSFYVNPDATKIQIKQAVEKMFDGVKVESVATMNIKGQTKRVGRYVGKTAAKKKAVVTLKQDSKDIELFAAN